MKYSGIYNLFCTVSFFLFLLEKFQLHHDSFSCLLTKADVSGIYEKIFRNSHRIPIERKADDYHVKFLPVTEPDSDHFFFHIETVRNVLDFFRSGFWVLIEGSFKSNANGGLDGGSFFTPPSKSVCSTQRTAIKST